MVPEKSLLGNGGGDMSANVRLYNPIQHVTAMLYVLYIRGGARSPSARTRLVGVLVHGNRIQEGACAARAHVLDWWVCW